MKKIFAISALMAAMASANALAVDANLTFSGSVTSGTCTMTAGDATQTLTIPDISSAALVANANAYATQAASTNIRFTSCPGSISKINLISLTTNGTAFSNNYTSIIPPSGSAANIHTVLFVNGNAPNADGSIISNNSSTVTSGAASVPIRVGVRANQTANSTLPAPTAGSYSDAYTLTFSWS